MCIGVVGLGHLRKNRVEGVLTNANIQQIYRPAEPCLCGLIDCPPGARRTGVDRYDINSLGAEFVSQVLRERGNRRILGFIECDLLA
jgi:hypothetical protein